MACLYNENGPACYYGRYDGTDPRTFEPDAECITADERKRWIEACRAARAGAFSGWADSGFVVLDGHVAHVTWEGFGPGIVHRCGWYR